MPLISVIIKAVYNRQEECIMYISANLPPLYGQFNQIRRDNYPFRNTFSEYLKTIAALGLKLNMDADRLVGVIEDILLRDARLPDIPEGNEPVKFRFTLEDETVKEWFEKSRLSNKAIVMYIIRMTLRLSVQFGTSLSRLTKRIEEIGLVFDADEKQEEDKTNGSELSVPESSAVKTDVMKRLSELVEKGDQLLAAEDEEPSGQVVDTNPLLSDFF